MLYKQCKLPGGIQLCLVQELFSQDVRGHLLPRLQWLLSSVSECAVYLVVCKLCVRLVETGSYSYTAGPRV